MSILDELKAMSAEEKAQLLKLLGVEKPYTKPTVAPRGDEYKLMQERAWQEKKAALAKQNMPKPVASEPIPLPVSTPSPIINEPKPATSVAPETTPIPVEQKKPIADMSYDEWKQQQLDKEEYTRLTKENDKLKSKAKQDASARLKQNAAPTANAPQGDAETVHKTLNQELASAKKQLASASNTSKNIDELSQKEVLESKIKSIESKLKDIKAPISSPKKELVMPSSETFKGPIEQLGDSERFSGNVINKLKDKTHFDIAKKSVLGKEVDFNKLIKLSSAAGVDHLDVLQTVGSKLEMPLSRAQIQKDPNAYFNVIRRMYNDDPDYVNDVMKNIDSGAAKAKNSKVVEPEVKKQFIKDSEAAKQQSIYDNLDKKQNNEKVKGTPSKKINLDNITKNIETPEQELARLKQENAMLSGGVDVADETVPAGTTKLGKSSVAKSSIPKELSAEMSKLAKSSPQEESLMKMLGGLRQDLTNTKGDKYYDRLKQLASGLEIYEPQGLSSQVYEPLAKEKYGVTKNATIDDIIKLIKRQGYEYTPEEMKDAYGYTDFGKKKINIADKAFKDNQALSTLDHELAHVTDGPDAKYTEMFKGDKFKSLPMVNRNKITPEYLKKYLETSMQDHFIDPTIANKDFSRSRILSQLPQSKYAEDSAKYLKDASRPIYKPTETIHAAKPLAEESGFLSRLLKDTPKAGSRIALSSIAPALGVATADPFMTMFPSAGLAPALAMMPSEANNPPEGSEDWKVETPDWKEILQRKQDEVDFNDRLSQRDWSMLRESK